MDLQEQKVLYNKLTEQLQRLQAQEQQLRGMIEKTITDRLIVQGRIEVLEENDAGKKVEQREVQDRKRSRDVQKQDDGK